MMKPQPGKLLLLVLVIALSLSVVGCPDPIPQVLQTPTPGPILPIPAAPADDFSFSQALEITNNSGGDVTDPIIAIPMIPYSAVEVGSWDITLGNGSTYEYNYDIPVRVANLADQTLTNYPVKVMIDTEWLKDNSWATTDGDEVIFTDADHDIIPFWGPEEPGYGWDQPDTIYWAAGNQTALGNVTWHMMIDPDLTSITSQSDSSIFEFFDDFTSDAEDWWKGSYTGTYEIAADAEDGHRQTSGVFGDQFVPGEDFAVFGTVDALDTTFIQDGFFYFGNVTLPQGASITSAYLRFNAQAVEAGDTVRTRIRAEDADDATVVTAYDSAPWNDGKDDADLTSASCDWDFTTDWAIDSWYETCDAGESCTGNITAIVQEIVNRGGWSSGNAMQFFVFDDSSDTDARRKASAREDSADESAELHVSYLAPFTSTDDVVTVSGDPIYLYSQDTFGLDVAVRIYANATDLDATEDSGCKWGFMDNTSDEGALFFNIKDAGDTTDKAILTDNGASTTEDDQYPFPIGEYATWDVMRRGNFTQHSKMAAWVRFDVNNVLTTDAPLWTNISVDDLSIYFYSSDDKDLDIDWVLVRDYVSPEPIVNTPQVHHDSQTVYLNDHSENWPKDVAITKQGNDTYLSIVWDKTTLASEFATTMYVEYIGTITDGATADLTLFYGDASQDTWGDWVSGADVFSGTGAFWDDWDDGTEDGWDENSGTWATSDQQRPEIYDYHLMNAYPDTSAMWGGTQTWTTPSGDEVMITFVGSWEGTTSNNQGDSQWPIPWELVRYVKTGSQWYRWGNILTGEYDEFDHASAIPYWMWQGDGAEMGNSSWVYMVVSTTTIAAGDCETWLFVSKDREGITWQVLNEGAPVADCSCLSGPDRGRFVQPLYEDGDYYFFYGANTGGDPSWRFGYLHGNSSDIQDMLYDDGTIVPADVWTNGGIIIEDLTIEEAHVYQKADGNWTAQIESVLLQDQYYSDCLAADFNTSMDTTDWSASAAIQNLNADYEWFRGDIATPKSIVGGSSPNMVFAGFTAGGMETNRGLAFANSTSFDGDDWSLHNIDKERSQTTDALAWQTSTITGGNYTSGEIICEATVGDGGADFYAGIVWRYEDDDNFCAWLVSKNEDVMRRGIKSDGVWGSVATYDPGESIWIGENYRLAVEFDGATTTLKYSRLGWDWVTAYEDIDMSDAHVANYGSAGTATMYTHGYFDDFRISPNALDDFAVEGLSEVTVVTNAATNIETTTVTLNGEITLGAAAVRGFAWSDTSHGAPGDVSPGSSDYASDPNGDSWTESEGYGLGTFSHNLSGLVPGTRYYYRAAAQSEVYPGTWYWGDEESFDMLGGLRGGVPCGVILLF